MDNACVVCLNVECNCYVAEEVVETIEEPEEELDFNSEGRIEKQVLQSKLGGGGITKWKRSGAFTTLHTAADWSRKRTDTEVFFSEVKEWAYNLPGDREETFGNAMLKYSELLKTHPKKSNAYYMQSIKNDRIHKFRLRKVVEIAVLELPESLNELEVVDLDNWFNNLTRYQKDTVQELIKHTMETPDEPISYELRRRIKLIPLP